MVVFLVTWRIYLAIIAAELARDTRKWQRYRRKCHRRFSLLAWALEVWALIAPAPAAARSVPAIGRWCAVRFTPLVSSFSGAQDVCDRERLMRG